MFTNKTKLKYRYYFTGRPSTGVVIIINIVVVWKVWYGCRCVTQALLPCYPKALLQLVRKVRASKHEFIICKLISVVVSCVLCMTEFWKIKVSSWLSYGTESIRSERTLVRQYPGNTWEREREEGWMSLDVRTYFMYARILHVVHIYCVRCEYVLSSVSDRKDPVTNI